MRPTRLLLSVLLSLLTVFLTLYSVILSRPRGESSTRTSFQRSSGFRALFSFRAPSSLFPPSAIISLTDDNSTFFLSRPAAYGPLLPPDGLSGQLWIGSGFLDDVMGQDAMGRKSGEELGCSDIPGWPSGKDPYGEVHADASRDKVDKSRATRDRKDMDPSGPATGSSADEEPKILDRPREEDGTDDHLHYPLPASSLASNPTSSKPNSQQPPEHADIQSLQESAEIAGKVVLLSRGGCGFLEKTKWVQRRGGIALIVGDNTRGGPLVNMYARDASNISIPSLFTSHTTAHLLCSLMPSDPNPIGALPLPEPKAVGNQGKNGETALDAKQGHDGVSGPNFTPVTGASARPTAPPHSGKAESPSKSSKGDSEKASGDGKGWFGNVFSHNDGKSGLNQDSRRPPSSGRLDWIQSDDWNDEPSKSGSKDSEKQPVAKGASKKGSTSDAKDKAQDSGDGFVIGVQDWRDPDLVDKGDDRNTKTQSTTTVSSTSPTPVASKKSESHPLPGGSRAPGSGVYKRPNGEEESAKAKGARKPKASPKRPKQRSGWLASLFGSSQRREPSKRSEGEQGAKKSSPSPKGRTASEKNQRASPKSTEHHGLWVTMTPTSVSTSPFFDTLLVLVVSPLVTLTIVYALLLLRSRIRRRRWRAPKSVVERLPVRTYQTMSCSTSSRSSHTPTPDASSPASPLLHSVTSNGRTRPRPRSQTLSALRHSADAALDRATARAALGGGGGGPEKPAPPRRYRGRQVECVVCLEEYVDGQSRVMSLPCGHEFHADCMFVPLFLSPLSFMSEIVLTTFEARPGSPTAAAPVPSARATSCAPSRTRPAPPPPPVRAPRAGTTPAPPTTIPRPRPAPTTSRPAPHAPATIRPRPPSRSRARPPTTATAPTRTTRCSAPTRSARWSPAAAAAAPAPRPPPAGATSRPAAGAR